MHAMDLDWDDLRVVLEVVRAGTLAGAGARLGVNYTTVARRVQRVERDLGEVLFERVPDGYRANDTARLVAEYAAGMESRRDGMLRALQGRDRRLSGRLVLTAPQLLVGPYLAPVLDRFCRRHPQVEVRLRATNDLLDLNRREADLAIRISRSPGDDLKGLRLCPQQSASFAAPEVAARIAADPAGPVDWIVYEQFPSVPLPALAGYPNSRVRMIFDDMAAMVGAARAGLGVVRMPLFLGRTTPGLVQVPVLPPQPYADLWLVGHRDVWPSAKLRAFRDIVVPHFRAARSDFVA